MHATGTGRQVEWQVNEANADTMEKEKANQTIQ